MHPQDSYKSKSVPRQLADWNVFHAKSTIHLFCFILLIHHDLILCLAQQRAIRFLGCNLKECLLFSAKCNIKRLRTWSATEAGGPKQECTATLSSVLTHSGTICRMLMSEWHGIRMITVATLTVNSVNFTGQNQALGSATAGTVWSVFVGYSDDCNCGWWSCIMGNIGARWYCWFHFIDFAPSPNCLLWDWWRNDYFWWCIKFIIITK